MVKVNQICDTCGGTGVMRNWIVKKEPVNREHSIGKLKKEECPKCKGTGYVEYAMFTLEEAAQIMKVCGLSTES